jgi:hypothetical protein
MKANLKNILGLAALGMTLLASGSVQSAPPGGTPPGKPPTEVTGSVAVTNFPATQNVTVGNEVDVNVITPARMQIHIVAGDSGDPDVVTGVIERADGGAAFSVVPPGKKVVLTDFIVRVGVPSDPVIEDSDDFLANINRAGVGENCSATTERRWQFRVFRRDQVIANLVTGLEYFAGEQVCLATGTPGDSPDNVDLSYQILGYLTDAP